MYFFFFENKHKNRFFLRKGAFLWSLVCLLETNEKKYEKIHDNPLLFCIFARTII